MTLRSPNDPPFDGQPCPMCPLGVRAFAAVASNLIGAAGRPDYERFTRKWPEWRDEVRRWSNEPFDHPDIEALRVVVLKAVNDAISDAALTVRGAMAIIHKVAPLLEPVQALSDAHFADRRHSHHHG